MTDVWAKLLVDEKRGQILVTKDWDENDDSDTVVIEVRSRATMQIRLTFPSEEMRDKAFDAITQDNVIKVIAGGVGALERLEVS